MTQLRYMPRNNFLSQKTNLKKCLVNANFEIVTGFEYVNDKETLALQCSSYFDVFKAGVYSAFAPPHFLYLHNRSIHF